MTQEEDIAVIQRAVARGLIEGWESAAGMLQPLVDAGPLSTFLMCGALAQLASYPARMSAPSEGFFGPVVVDSVTEEPEPLDVLPAPLRFVAQFTAAFANQDMATAEALFEAFAFESDRAGTPDLGQAIRVLFEMAVTSAAELVNAARAQS
ncbi:hypothetical protein [Streptomyces fuscigenes]|uniref:hypothetical protein n=1 Tax=Streptomyces fuscigenes TaxID=1528880 RepID=UPI001F3C1FFA|nr:hypothetical protein [Streptomyces fuscigenes]MCF3960319.1 hypothetical protein [Streptomyces fuscigenes]